MTKLTIAIALLAFGCVVVSPPSNVAPDPKTEFTLKDLPPCQILYLTDSVDQKTALDAVKMLRDKPVLLVGDVSEFTENGGCTAFELDESGAVRIKVNVAEVRARKIGMDVRLSKLAVTKESKE